MTADANTLSPRLARYQALTLRRHGPVLEVIMGAAQSANQKQIGRAHV